MPSPSLLLISLLLSPLLLSPLSLAHPSSRSSPPAALEFDFTQSLSCDGTPDLFRTYPADNKCTPLNRQGRNGAQVKNVANQNVRLRLFKDAKCDPKQEVYGDGKGNGTVLTPGSNTCFAEIYVAASLMVAYA